MNKRHQPRMLRVLIALVALAAMAWPAASPAVASAQDPALRGIQITQVRPDTSVAQIRSDLDRARSLGAGVVRTEFSWALLEPNSAEKNLDYLAKMDALVNGAAARRIRVEASVWQSPCWAVAPGNCSVDSRGVAHTNRTSITLAPSNSASYAEAASFMAGRYGSRLTAIEVWNEPDSVDGIFWRAPDVVGAYADLLKTAYPAIKHANPGITVLGGSLLGGNGVFLRALYAHGIQGSYDGLAIHHYPLVLSAIRTIHATMLAAGDHAPLWLTEFGLNTCRPMPGVVPPCVSRAQQAQGIDDVVRALRSASYVHAALIYQLDDSDGAHLGIWGKPAQKVVARAFAGRLGPLRAPTIWRVRNRRSGRAFAAGTAPYGDLIEVRVFTRRLRSSSRTLRVIATVVPDRSGRYSVPLPAALGRARLLLQVRFLWDGRTSKRRV